MKTILKLPVNFLKYFKNVQKTFKKLYQKIPVNF